MKKKTKKKELETILHSHKLTTLKVSTTGISEDGSATLYCIGAKKRKDYMGRSRIVLRVVVGRDIMSIHVESVDYQAEYLELRKRLRERKIVPIYVPYILVTSYTCSNLYGLKLYCSSFAL